MNGSASKQASKPAGKMMSSLIASSFFGSTGVHRTHHKISD